MCVCACALKNMQSIWELKPLSSLAGKCASTRVLHAVRIALKAGAQRLCRGIQIRKGPLSVCVRHY